MWYTFPSAKVSLNGGNFPGKSESRMQKFPGARVCWIYQISLGYTLSRRLNTTPPGWQIPRPQEPKAYIYKERHGGHADTALGSCHPDTIVSLRTTSTNPAPPAGPSVSELCALSTGENFSTAVPHRQCRRNWDRDTIFRYIAGLQTRGAKLPQTGA